MESNQYDAAVLLLDEYARIASKVSSQVEALESVIKTLTEPLENIKDKLREIIPVGEKVESMSASATYRLGYVRTSWDSDMLKGFMLVHPELGTCMKETEVGPSLVVKVK